MSPRSVAIALFTRDLRMHDNPVLHTACRAYRVVPLFVLDEAITESSFLRPNRAAFLLESLADLDTRLRDAGGRLVVRRGDTVDEVRAVADQVGAAEVHVAADVSAFAQHRTARLDEALRAAGRALVVHEGSITAVPPGDVVPTGRDHFAVFTPYFRRWSTVSRRNPLPTPSTVTLPRLASGSLPATRELCPGRESPHRPAGGESAARDLLRAWTSEVCGYAERHDDLAADRTSRLSPYLHFGCVSPVEVISAVESHGPGADAFVRQVAWRDFHHQVLAARPYAARRDYRPHGDRWRRDKTAFRAWQRGRTGYPIIDAGMRQLADEGWLHNRARMLVASFLTKTLYLDWRLGAQHFLDLLVDGDIANNQMNWQWVAGTGNDSRPNRVLNPITQARRHDPEGDYVRRYLPELRTVAGPAVHEPWRLPAQVRADLDYPEPIVDAREGARRFLRARGK